MTHETDKDPVTGTETTGHEWDGIRELNTPLPRWWLWTFYATIAWSAIYVVLFPAIPGFGGALGWSSREQAHEQISLARSAQQGLYDRIDALSLEEIRADPAVFQFAVDGGRAAFAVNCSQCHGSGAQGGHGYPNLNDDAWIWGGGLEQIRATLEHGVRYAFDDETRWSEMPAFGRDGILQRPQILAVAHHVRGLAGLDHDAAAAEEGRQVYADNCAACHKDDGSGDPELGAPALDDAIWLYGGDYAQIVRQVTAPRHGVMPAWGHRLDEATLKQLAVYVHSLGGGE